MAKLFCVVHEDVGGHVSVSITGGTMRNAIAVIGLVVLCSCASKEAIDELAAARAAVAQLQQQMQADKIATGKDNESLRSLLRDAETRLNQAKETVRVEKIQSVTAPVATVAETAAPWADKLMPGLGAGLVLLAGIANKIGGQKKAVIA